MSMWATENVLEGRIWPAGRLFETLGLYLILASLQAVSEEFVVCKKFQFSVV